MVKRAISVDENLTLLAADMLKLRHQPLETAGTQGEQNPIAGPV